MDRISRASGDVPNAARRIARRCEASDALIHDLRYRPDTRKTVPAHVLDRLREWDRALTEALEGVEAALRESYREERRHDEPVGTSPRREAWLRAADRLAGEAGPQKGTRSARSDPEAMT